MNGIVGRDLAEHGWALLPAIATAGLLLLVITVLAMFPQLGGFTPDGLLRLIPVERDPLAALRVFVIVALTPLAYLLIDRLISVEYRRSGWDSLERLPIGRVRVVYSKLVVVVALLGGLLACGWLVILSASVTVQREVPDEAATAALWSAAGYVTVMTGYLFATATLGRRRLLAHALVAGGLLLAVRHGLSLRAVPGAGYLVGQVGGGLANLALGGALTLLGFVCACAGSGRLARACQGPITRVDLAWPAGLAVALLVAATPVGPPPPVGLSGAVARAGLVTVRLPDTDDALRADALAGAIARDRARLLELGLRAPSIAVDHAPSFDGETWERARLNRPGGLLVRANVAHPQLRERALRAWVRDQAIEVAAGRRLDRGGWRLLGDGLGSALDPTLATRADRSTLAAWALTRLGSRLDASLLLAWEGVTERCGAAAARALAAWVLLQLVDAQGEAALTQWVRGALASRRALFGAVGPRPAAFRAVFATATGADLDGFAASLTEAGRALCDREQAALARLPSAPTGALELVDGRLTVAGARDSAVAIVHGRLPDTLAEARPRAWERDEAAPSLPLVSTRRYPSGSRVRAARVVRVGWLGADLVFGWQELRVP